MPYENEKDRSAAKKPRSDAAEKRNRKKRDGRGIATKPPCASWMTNSIQGRVIRRPPETTAQIISFTSIWAYATGHVVPFSVRVYAIGHAIFLRILNRYIHTYIYVHIYKS